MYVTKLLAEATDLARQLDYTIREEYLDGAGGGHCYFGGKKWLLLDVTQSVEEQLSDVADALRAEADVWQHSMTPAMTNMLQVRRAA